MYIKSILCTKCRPVLTLSPAEVKVTPSSVHLAFCFNIFAFFWHCVHNFRSFFAPGARCIKLCVDSQLKLCVCTKKETCIPILFVRSIESCVSLIYVLKSQSLWRWVHMQEPHFHTQRGIDLLSQTATVLDVCICEVQTHSFMLYGQRVLDIFF